MSSPLNSAPRSPFQADQNPKHFQFSLGSMMLIMLVFCFTSLGLYYSMKVPAIANELKALFGINEQPATQNTDRAPQFAFVMFCFTGPLIAAAITSVATRCAKRFIQFQSKAYTDNEEAPF